MRSKIIPPVAAVLFLLLAIPVQAEVSAEQRAKIENASSVFRNALDVSEGGIPKEVFKRAQGVAVIPGLVKGAFVAGGRYGDGVLVVKMDKDTWSSPAFISLTGASLGAQAGVEVSDLILVFNNQKAVNAMKDGKLEFGADAALVAGPMGGKGEWSGDAQADADVYAYTRNARGIFAGVSLRGSVMQFDDSANASFYGKEEMSPEMIFARGPETQAMAKNEFTCAVAKTTGGSPTC